MTDKAHLKELLLKNIRAALTDIVDPVKADRARRKIRATSNVLWRLKL